MTRTRRVITLLLLLSLGTSTIAQGKKPLTNPDVVAMVKAGFDATTIIKAINANVTQFDLSAQALLDLNEAGVPKPVITAMMDAEAKPDSGVPKGDQAPPTGPGQSTPGIGPTDSPVAASNDGWPQEVAGMSREEGLYYKQEDGAFVRIWGKPVAAATGGGGPRMWIPFGGRKVKAVIQGKHAQIQLTERQPVFYAFVAQDFNPGSSTLLRLDTKGNRREFEVGSFSGVTGSTRSGLDFDKTVGIIIEQLAPRLFRARPDRELKEGEYGFVSTYVFAAAGGAGAGEMIYDFGIRKRK